MQATQICSSIGMRKLSEDSKIEFHIEINIYFFKIGVSAELMWSSIFPLCTGPQKLLIMDPPDFNNINTFYFDESCITSEAFKYVLFFSH